MDRSLHGLLAKEPATLPPARRLTSPQASPHPPNSSAPRVVDTGTGGPTAPSAITGFNAGVFYNISSNAAAGYTEPTQFSLSASLQINTIQDGSGGQAYAFGSNGYGQLGNTTNNGNSSAANPTPTLVAGLSNVTAIAAGSQHSLTLTGAGNVLSFGGNSFGQLGNGTTNNAANPTPYEVQYNGANLANIVQVAAGANSSYALAANGSLYVWGYNGDGELGLGNTTQQYTTPQLLVPPTGQYYQLIDSDSSGFFALAILGNTPPSCPNRPPGWPARCSRSPPPASPCAVGSGWPERTGPCRGGSPGRAASSRFCDESRSFCRESPRCRQESPR